MIARLAAWVRKRPVLAFYLLTFAISWLAWLPQAAYSHGLVTFQSPPPLYAVGGIGPGLAAIIVWRVVRGKEGDAELYGPLLRWRIGAAWYVVALFGYAAIWLAALGLSGELAPELEKFFPSLALLPVFLICLLAAVPEEVGWRGFALPRLQAQYGALAASLIVGVLWALWHLPLLLTSGTVMATYPLLPYLLAVTALAVVYTWLFNSTRGNLLIVAVFHGASNVAGPFVGIEQTMVVFLLAAAIVAIFGPARLSRRGADIMPKAEVAVLAVGAAKGRQV